jgi:hypothetical protein
VIQLTQEDPRSMSFLDTQVLGPVVPDDTRVDSKQPEIELNVRHRDRLSTVVVYHNEIQLFLQLPW